MRLLLLVVSLLLAFAVGWLSRGWYVAASAPTVSERALVVEEQIRKIAQFATAEQYYNEFFTHKQVGYIDLPFFNKSLMVRARARVVMGFDLEGIQVDVQQDDRTVTVRNWPAPQELAFEVNSSYFDFEQGLFNGFETDELNAVDETVEATLRGKIDYAALSTTCYAQADDLLSGLRANLALMGWTLEVEDWPATARTAVID